MELHGWSFLIMDSTTGNPKSLGPCWQCGWPVYEGMSHQCPTGRNMTGTYIVPADIVQVIYPEVIPVKVYRVGQPCDHPGCLHHISHPCEGCGRIAGGLG